MGFRNKETIQQSKIKSITMPFKKLLNIVKQQNLAITNSLGLYKLVRYKLDSQ
jgi:hypothetical protein